MTERNPSVIFPPQSIPHGTIINELVSPSPRHGHVQRRRRLGLLTAALLATLTVGSLVGTSDGSVPVAAGASERTTDDGSFGPAAAAAPAHFGSTPSTLGSTSTSAALGLEVADETTTTTAAEEETTSTTATSEATTTTAAERESTEPEAAPQTSQAPPTTAAPATTAPPTTQAPPPPPPSTQPSSEQYAYDDPRSTQVWLDLAQCEAGGNWAANTGNGYYGGLQFSLGSWEAVGGTGYPHEHSRDQQIEMGRRLQARQGWGAWPHCSEKLGLR